MSNILSKSLTQCMTCITMTKRDKAGMAMTTSLTTIKMALILMRTCKDFTLRVLQIVSGKRTTEIREVCHSTEMIKDVIEIKTVVKSKLISDKSISLILKVCL